MDETVKVTADIIKTAVMAYYRYRRQRLCADEVSVLIAGETADVLVETEKGFFDVEIKISKSDLWQGEAKKYKHTKYLNAPTNPKQLDCPNYFILCVPEDLVEEGKKWIEATNPRYGLIAFSMWSFSHNIRWENLIRYVRTPKLIHPSISPRLKDMLTHRLCSAYITQREREYQKSHAKE